MPLPSHPPSSPTHPYHIHPQTECRQSAWNISRLPARCRRKTVEARSATGVDKVQAGEGLETGPYTGKGVIVGVIDQRFRIPPHRFPRRQRQSRVVAVWNRKGFSEGKDLDPTTDIPANGDGLNVEGHATHVTNIAAGSKISGKQLLRHGSRCRHHHDTVGIWRGEFSKM